VPALLSRYGIDAVRDNQAKLVLEGESGQLRAAQALGALAVRGETYGPINKITLVIYTLKKRILNAPNTHNAG
jgi:hypothetical protein